MFSAQNMSEEVLGEDIRSNSSSQSSQSRFDLEHTSGAVSYRFVKRAVCRNVSLVCARLRASDIDHPS